MRISNPGDPMEFKVRPFDRDFGPAARAATRASGTLEGTTYVIALGGAKLDGERISLPTVRVDEDERGPFAVVCEFDTMLRDEWHVRLAPSHEEGLPGYRGCEFTIFTRDRIKYERIAIAAGVDIEGKEVIAPPYVSLSINFNTDGSCDGWGS